MRVTLYKSSDGTLHETREGYLKQEARLKLIKNLNERSLHIGNLNTYDHSDNFLMSYDDIVNFIADNAERLREELNSAYTFRRERKPRKK